MGDWKINEVIDLIKMVEAATQITIIDPQVEIKFKFDNDGKENKQFHVSSGSKKVRIYS